MSVQTSRSEEYTQAINDFKTAYYKSTELSNRVVELGRRDGLSDSEIRKDVEDAFEGKLTDRQVRRILPFELKHTEKITKTSKITKEQQQEFDRITEEGVKDADIMSASVVEESPTTQYEQGDYVPEQETIETTVDDTGIWKMQSVEDFTVRDIDHYETSYIHDVIQIIVGYHNKRNDVGSKLIIKTAMGQKKEQPTPQEVEERRLKVLEMVEKLIEDAKTVKIGELVKDVGFSESATRRYLESSGYHVVKGIVQLKQ